MFPAPLPPNENERIAALKALNILDTPPEERFDRITRVTKRIFGVPIALVTLVDVNRLWFKSCIGLDGHEVPRGISFCAHAILREEAFVVPDALKDPRFADNPLVTSEPHIRFYAGYPTHNLDGNKLGTLCILDRNPREITAEDVKTLRDLAAWAELEINAPDMRQALNDAKESKKGNQNAV